MKVWTCLAHGGEGVYCCGDWITAVGRSNTAYVPKTSSISRSV